MISNLFDHPWTLIFPALTIGALVLSATSQRAGRWPRAFLGSALFLVGLLTTMAAGLYPKILPAHDGRPYSLTVHNAATGHHGLTTALVWWPLGMVLAAFNFSEELVREPGEAQTLVAIALAGVLLGFLVLASAPAPFSQMVGALRIENSIALLELSDDQHPPPALQLALLGVFVATVAFFRWYLATLRAPEGERESSPDSLTL